MAHIRLATAADIERLAQIEAVCFPPEQAASLARFRQRFAVFPECFYLIEVDGQVAGHINGCITDRPTLPDALYSDPQLHCPKGDYQTVFGLVVDPDYQHRGYAGMLLEHLASASRDKGCKGIVLTCKESLIGFYEKHGYVQQGLSDSTHGGASWWEMLRTF